MPRRREPEHDPDEFQTVEVFVAASRAVPSWAHIYELPRPSPYGFEQRHNFTFSLRELTATEEGAAAAEALTVIRQAGRWADEAHVSARSARRPEVVPLTGDMFPDPSRVADLERELRMLSARNLGPDAVFDGRDVLLWVRPYRWTNPQRVSGCSLLLEQVGVAL